MPRPARPWFRFYVEAVHDRKLRRLKPEHRWLFVACLAAARQSCEPGVLLVGEDDPMDIADLADFAGMSTKDTAAGIAALVTVGIVDWDIEDDVYSVPSFSQRQYESDNVTERTRKHRSKERSNVVPGNVPETVVGTHPETEAETDTETPPTPLIDQIVDAVFDRVVAAKKATGAPIASVAGFRKWWDANDGQGCRKRAEWVIENYEMKNLSQYRDAVASQTMPQWAASMKRVSA